MVTEDSNQSEEKYINILTDFGFKKLLGTEPNKYLLRDFLNLILPEQHQIKDLTYKKTENLGNTPLDRKAIFDIYCESETGEKFIVEVQKAKQNYFKDRSIYYATFPIQEQAKKGDWNFKLSSVYTVGILDFIFEDHKKDENLLHYVELKNQDCKVFYDKLKFIYLELPKFEKTEEELESHLDKWLFVLTHLSELSSRPVALEEKIFDKLFAAAEIARFSPEERQAYETSLKYYRDIKNVVDTSLEEGLKKGMEEGLKKGLQKGREEGIQKGREETLKEVVRSMKLAGFANSDIAKYTGLSESEVEQL
ncbi:MAG: Rpn family recombination-promoting nuclease/putative transposase [Symploca sp. SIO2C1]|nr:Rpn family recombination-promoting nuclease/putative transposase [Symploca sp. SIO2C1]